MFKNGETTKTRIFANGELFAENLNQHFEEFCSYGELNILYTQRSPR